MKESPAEAQGKRLQRTAHIGRHVTLHKSLSELIADWLACSEEASVNASVFDLTRWSAKQMTDPDKEKHAVLM